MAGADSDPHAIAPEQGVPFVYIGSGAWGSGTAGAVTVYRLDPATVELTFSSEVPAGGLASFLATDSASATLYAADEAVGNLKSYAIDRTTGALARLNEQSTAGNPVYVTVDGSDRFVLTAHYTQGLAEVLERRSDGRLAASSNVQSSGDQAHSIVLSPDNRYAFVPNKGDDSITQYVFDRARGTLAPNTPARIGTASGAGPRHLTFHPNGAVAYVINELDNTITTYAYDAPSGTLSPLGSTPTLPDTFSGASAAADVHVSPDGRFVYGSNRISGNDGSLAIFRVAADGTLSPAGHESTRGRTPRNFEISRAGDLLLVANQESDTIVAFRMDPETGALTFARQTAIGKSPFFVGILWLTP